MADASSSKGRKVARGASLLAPNTAGFSQSFPCADAVHVRQQSSIIIDSFLIVCDVYFGAKVNISVCKKVIFAVFKKQIMSHLGKFPEYKGLNLSSVNRDILRFWKGQHIFEKSMETREGRPSFVFYEGPPSANGMPGFTMSWPVPSKIFF
jgi:hypothetical protein